jgi:hypothetical protein
LAGPGLWPRPRRQAHWPTGDSGAQDRGRRDISSPGRAGPGMSARPAGIIRIPAQGRTVRTFSTERHFSGRADSSHDLMEPVPNGGSRVTAVNLALIAERGLRREVRECGGEDPGRIGQVRVDGEPSASTRAYRPTAGFSRAAAAMTVAARPSPITTRPCWPLSHRRCSAAVQTSGLPKAAGNSGRTCRAAACSQATSAPAHSTVARPEPR